MKLFNLFFVSSILLIINLSLNAQNDSTLVNKQYSITKNDGSIYVGEIISQDAREVLIRTGNLGDIIIPKHVIYKIEEVKAGQFDTYGNFIGETIFSTRYFITTNGLPLKKGKSYILWNFYGPDFQFGVGKNTSIGIMSSWVGIPIIGSIKYSLLSNDNASLGLGALLGTGSWILPDYALALPYAVFTLGNYTSNFNISAGYGALILEGDAEGRLLFSVAGISKISSKISLVFDSFIAPAVNKQQDGVAIFIPGLRWQSTPKSAFQFGFTGVYAVDEFLPVPIPMVQWFRKID